MPDDQSYSPPINPTNDLMAGLLPAGSAGNPMGIPADASVPLPGTGYRAAGAPAVGAASDPTQIKAQILAHLRQSEGANYNTLYGGGTFNSYAAHPNIGFVGPDGRPTHAAGGYQFQPATWQQQKEKLGLKDFSPQSQDTAAWDLAQQTYKQNTGRDISADAAAGKVNWGALGDQWASLKGKGIGPALPASALASTGSPMDISPKLPAVASTGSPAGDSNSRLLHAMLLMQIMAPNHKFIPVDYDPFKTQPHV